MRHTAKPAASPAPSGGVSPDPFTRLLEHLAMLRRMALDSPSWRPDPVQLLDSIAGDVERIRNGVAQQPAVTPSGHGPGGYFQVEQDCSCLVCNGSKGQYVEDLPSSDEGNEA